MSNKKSQGKFKKKIFRQMKIKTQTQDTKIYQIQQERCLEVAIV